MLREIEMPLDHTIANNLLKSLELSIEINGPYSEDDHEISLYVYLKDKNQAIIGRAILDFLTDIDLWPNDTLSNFHIKRIDIVDSKKKGGLGTLLMYYSLMVLENLGAQNIQLTGFPINSNFYVRSGFSPFSDEKNKECDFYSLALQDRIKLVVKEFNTPSNSQSDFYKDGESQILFTINLTNSKAMDTLRTQVERMEQKSLFKNTTESNQLDFKYLLTKAVTTSQSELDLYKEEDNLSSCEDNKKMKTDKQLINDYQKQAHQLFQVQSSQLPQQQTTLQYQMQLQSFLYLNELLALYKMDFSYDANQSLYKLIQHTSLRLFPSLALFPNQQASTTSTTSTTTSTNQNQQEDQTNLKLKRKDI